MKLNLLVFLAITGVFVFGCVQGEETIENPKRPKTMGRKSLQEQRQNTMILTKSIMSSH